MTDDAPMVRCARTAHDIAGCRAKATAMLRAATVASATHLDLGRRPARRSSWCHGQRGRVAYASDAYIRTTVHPGSTRVDGWMLLGGIEQHGLALMGPPLALMGPADSLNALDE